MRNRTKSAQDAIHMSNLAEIFGLTVEGVCHIYKHLKRIETDGHRIAEKYCNGDIDSDQYDECMKKLKNNLLATLNYAKSDVIRNIEFNGDPRGYFMKINNEYVRKNKLQIETDWGGHGIICPEGV